MKQPSNLGCSASVTELPSTSTSDWRQLRGGGEGPGGAGPLSALSSSLTGGILRGGSTQTAKQPETSQSEEYEYVDAEEDGYYYTDDGDGEGVEYEYYEDDDGDGYYYGDEYYEGEVDEDGYIYLPDTDDGEPVAGRELSKQRQLSTKKRKLASIGKTLRPITSKATLSITGAIPAAIPVAVSNLSKSISSNLGQFSGSLSNFMPNSLKELNNVEAGSMVVLSMVIVAVVARTVSSILGNNTPSPKGTKKKRKKRTGKNNSVRQKSMGWNNLWKKVTPGKKAVGSVSDVDIEKDGDDLGGEDGETMDLDLVDDKSSIGSKKLSGKQERKWRMLSSPRSSLAKIIPSASAKNMVQDAWSWTCALGSRCRPPLRLGGRIKGKEKKTSTSTAAKSLDIDVSIDDNSAQTKVDSGAGTDPEAIAIAEQLQQDLDTLTESHHTLEQEYEASLRMLHEARIELRQLQSKQHGDDGSDMQLQQKQQMEALVKKMEAKYKSQMKEQIERLRAQMEGKLRTEMEAKLTEQLTSQYQSQMKEEQAQLEERLQQEMEQRLARSKEVQKSELDSDFKRAVDEAASIEVDRILEEAVQTAVNEERQKSREEMLRVRAGIQKVLERERALMKDQVRRATGQVRDWLAREQREQLLQQAKQLQEEAEKFGGSGNRGQRGGRSAAEAARGRSRSEGARGRGGGARPSVTPRDNNYEQ